ncbi:hypothetical protein [Methylophaga sp. UBA5088]|uniref:hypothetical protein n=1 Tax=Methylophaga sp. UBA5088 TaxID=1946898 RepID=UPI00259CDEED|nr:hypothetical protein [Methylophaga sp. UBA5088]
MDYPHGETRIQISSNNDAYLFYGAIPKYKKIKAGVFELQQVYELLKPHLQKNLPSNERPCPDAIYGMVVILYSDNTQESFLIYNLEEVTSTIFEMADNNVIEVGP